MKRLSWTFSGIFGVKVGVVFMAVFQLACSPALISILGNDNNQNTGSIKTWASQLGSGSGTSSAPTNNQGGAITDALGNTTVCSTTTGTASSTFPFGPASGVQDGYVIQFSKSGAVNWSKQISGGAGSTTLIYGCLSNGQNDGSIYVAGQSTADFSVFGATSIGGLAGVLNALLFKFSTDGTLQWARQIAAGASQTTTLTGAIADSAGNFDLVGTTTVSDLGGATIVSSGTLGTTNGFVIKLSPGGTVAWSDAFGAGASWFAQPQGVVTDSSNNVYIVGTTSGMVTSTASSHGTQDIFVYKLNSLTGAASFGTQYGDGAGNKLGNGCSGNNNQPGIQLDSAGNTYVWGGACATSAPFLTALGVPGSTYNTTNGDLFVSQISPAGTVGWGKRLECGTSPMSGCSLNFAQSGSGNQGGVMISGSTIYVAGQINGSGYAITTNLAGTQGYENLFYVTLSSGGTVATDVQIGPGTSMGSLNLNRAFLDVSGNIYFSGSANGASFSPSYTYQSAGFSDCYIMSFNSLGATNWAADYGATGGTSIGGMLNNCSGQFDPSGNIAMTATYSPQGGGNATFGSKVIGTSGGSAYNDGVIFQVAPTNGNVNWTVDFGAGTSNYISFNNVSINDNGIFVMGSVSVGSGNVNLSGTAGAVTGNGLGTSDLFVTGISTSGFQ